MATNRLNLEELKALRPGDVIRDKLGKRYRITGLAPNDQGLRVHDLVRGPRDMSFQEISLLLPTLEPKEYGGAARKLGDLRREAETLGIATTGEETSNQLKILIFERLATGQELVQIEPQLSQGKIKDLQDYTSPRPWTAAPIWDKYWNSPYWGVDEKIDGVRLKMHFTQGTVRVDSRHRDTKTRRFSEKTANFPHLQDLYLPELEGTVLDCEGLIPVYEGTLPSGVQFQGALWISVAATNASADYSQTLQDEFGLMQFHCFDILRIQGGEDFTNRTYRTRRAVLKSTIQQIHDKIPEATKYFYHTRYMSASMPAWKKVAFYETLIARGGEGVILKDERAPYKPGKRVIGWQKLKKFQEVDAYVIGFTPGKFAHEGYVGVLHLAIKLKGKEHPIASISHFTYPQRMEMTDESGGLKQEYLNKVVTFRGQELTKSGLFRHATFVTFREDKSPENCDGHEIEDQL